MKGRKQIKKRMKRRKGREGREGKKVVKEGNEGKEGKEWRGEVCLERLASNGWETRKEGKGKKGYKGK